MKTEITARRITRDQCVINMSSPIFTGQEALLAYVKFRDEFVSVIFNAGGVVELIRDRKEITEANALGFYEEAVQWIKESEAA